MCGIVGVQGYQNSAEIAEKILKAINYRGPDDAGIILNADNAIGMCRLRIRSEVHDSIPFKASNDNHTAYNGEIYALVSEIFDDYPEVKHLVQGGSHEVDAIVLNKDGYPDGMYSLIELSGNELTLYRDKYGIKPLYYREDEGHFLCCSEMKPLLDPLFGRSHLDKTALIEFLIFGKPIIQSQTLIHEVKSLCPGEIGKKSNDSLIREIAINTKKIKPSRENYSILRKLINESIEQCLMSDRQVGLALSGGIDSSILAWELNDLGVENLITVSVISENSRDGIKDLSELALPKNGAWQTWRHVVVNFSEEDIIPYTHQAVETSGQPIGLTSYPLYFKLAQYAQKAGITVLLTGEGADEIFAGYESYSAWQMNYKIQNKPIENILNFYLSENKNTFLSNLIGKESIHLAKTKFEKCISNDISDGNLRDLLQIERDFSLEPLLIRTDLALMRYSIEGRVPFLHRGIPEFVSQIKKSLLLTGETKPILRELYSDYKRISEIKKTPFRLSSDILTSKTAYEWYSDVISQNLLLVESLDFNISTISQLLTKKNMAKNPAFLYKLTGLILWIKFHGVSIV